MLSHEDAIVRLAGIQALARLADDSDRDRSTCLGTLCSYLRRPVEVRGGDGEIDPNRFRECVTNKQSWLDPDEWDVRRNTLKLLLDRLERTQVPIEEWDLRESIFIEPDFAGREFFAAIDARGAVFVDDASFERTVFLGSLQLSNCYFAGKTVASGLRSPLHPVFQGCLFKGHFEYDYVHPWGLMANLEDCNVRWRCNPAHRLALLSPRLLWLSCDSSQHCAPSSHALNFQGGALNCQRTQLISAGAISRRHPL